jgi:hypothetical protein
VRLIVLGLCAALAAACSSNTCGPGSCNGCCASDGTCKAGTSLDVCGTGGNACDVCVSPQVCNGACMNVAVDSGVPDAGMMFRCGATPTTCSDQAIQDFGYKTTANTASVTNTTDGGEFDSTVDATAGGITPTKGFVYAKFTDVGLVGLNLDDQSSLDSLDWDIAFRRFVIRLNGGTSGPSCVGAFLYPKTTAFDAAALPAEDAGYRLDTTFSAPPACTFMDDGSGLSTSPATALDTSPTASFYNYTSCVKMTGQVFAVQTRDGRIVKLEVTGYYSTDVAQQQCQGGTMPMVAGGTIRLRWSYLQ